jgi:hypothetical protein
MANYRQCQVLKKNGFDTNVSYEQAAETITREINPRLQEAL